MIRLCLFVIVLFSVSSTSIAQEITAEVEKIFKDNCARCHNPTSNNEKAKKDIPDILNFADLIKRRMLVPGDPDASEIWRQVKNDEMPDGIVEIGGEYLTGEKPVPGPDKDILYNWIASLEGSQQLAERKFISDGEVLRYIFDDLSRVSSKRAKDHRYFTLTNLHNDLRITEEELESARQGLAKMVNSLSRKRTVIKPQPVDPAGTVLRVNIRHLGWDAELWAELAETSPYKKFYSSIFTNAIVDHIGVSHFVIRADWFVAKVSKPPLYHVFADIPETVQELEKRLLFDGLTADENLAENPLEVLRAGFDQGNSGVSAQNRLIERHPSKYGAYWRSFDFNRPDPGDPATETRDFFKFPVGPGGDQGFTPDGGEIIFNLPNGFQGYMLVDADGKRIDEGPTEIVFDRNAAAESRNPAIVNGISCIACHSAGMIIKEDQLLGHVQSSLFELEIREYVEELHRPDDLAEAFDEDQERFLEALTDAGVTLVSRDDEPVIALVRRFEERKVDLITAAAELGLTADQLEKAAIRLKSDRDLVGTVARLKNGGVPREQFILIFAKLANAVGIKQKAELVTKLDLKKQAELLDQQKTALENNFQSKEKAIAKIVRLYEKPESIIKLSKITGRWDLQTLECKLYFYDDEVVDIKSYNGFVFDFGQGGIRFDESEGLICLELDSEFRNAIEEIQ